MQSSPRKRLQKDLNRNDMNHHRKLKLRLPKPDADKILNTAFGRGMAEVIAEKQARIDRLERLIWMLYENVVRSVDSTIIMDDDMETRLCCEIQDKVKELNDNLVEASRKFSMVCTELSNAEDTIQKLKHKNK